MYTVHKPISQFIPRKPQCGLLIETTILRRPDPLVKSEHGGVYIGPELEFPTYLRRQLKALGPKVEIGRSYRNRPCTTPAYGPTPVLTARTLMQLSGDPQHLEVDPRLDPPRRHLKLPHVGYMAMLAVTAGWIAHVYIR